MHLQHFCHPERILAIKIIRDSSTAQSDTANTKRKIKQLIIVNNSFHSAKSLTSHVILIEVLRSIMEGRIF